MTAETCTDPRTIRMAAAVKAGATVAETARRFGVNRQVVRDACKEHGVDIPKGGRRL